MVRHVIVTKVCTMDRDVTLGKRYPVIEIDRDGCRIIDDAGELQYMFWNQVEFFDGDVKEDGELNKFISVKYLRLILLQMNRLRLEKKFHFHIAIRKEIHYFLNLE